MDSPFPARPGRGACPGPVVWPLVVSSSAGLSTQRARGDAEGPFYWGPSLPFWEPTPVTVRNSVSQLHDQETLNLGQVRMVMRVVYQESEPAAKVRERSLLELLEAGPRPTCHCASHLGRSLFPATLLRLCHCTGLFESRTPPSALGTAETAPAKQKASGVHGSCHESPQPPMTLRMASNRGQPGDTIQTPGATRTEEIIYHLPLPGCKRRGT